MYTALVTLHDIKHQSRVMKLNRNILIWINAIVVIVTMEITVRKCTLYAAAPYFCRHPSVQNAILSHKVQWPAFFLVPSSDNMGPNPRFCLSRILCQFFQIFFENHSLFQNLFFSLTVLMCLCVSGCVCACARACTDVHICAVCVFELLTWKYMYVLDL